MATLKLAVNFLTAFVYRMLFERNDPVTLRARKQVGWWQYDQDEEPRRVISEAIATSKAYKAAGEEAAANIVVQMMAPLRYALGERDQTLEWLDECGDTGDASSALFLAEHHLQRRDLDAHRSALIRGLETARHPKGRLRLLRLQLEATPHGENVTAQVDELLALCRDADPVAVASCVTALLTHSPDAARQLTHALPEPGRDVQERLLYGLARANTGHPDGAPYVWNALTPGWLDPHGIHKLQLARLAIACVTQYSSPFGVELLQRVVAAATSARVPWHVRAGYPVGCWPEEPDDARTVVAILRALVDEAPLPEMVTHMGARLMRVAETEPRPLTEARLLHHAWMLGRPHLDEAETETLRDQLVQRVRDGLLNDPDRWQSVFELTECEGADGQPEMHAHRLTAA